MTAESIANDLRIEAGDGLMLHVREWRPDAPRGLPVVCLPGLARTLEDFIGLAEFLSSNDGGRRQVFAISARGRGLSDWDSDPSRYTLKVESEDAIAALDRLSIAKAAFVGTSRGGLQSMMIAALRPALPCAVVLNDIGPAMELSGLRRVRNGVSRRSVPADFAAAAARLEHAHGSYFPALERADWDRWARRAWREAPDGLRPACDPALSETMAGLDLDKPIEPMWQLFDALVKIPVMVVRGEHSDILSAESLAELHGRRPDIVRHVTPGQGHAPLLEDRPTQDAIARFLDASGA